MCPIGRLFEFLFLVGFPKDGLIPFPYHSGLGSHLLTSALRRGLYLPLPLDPEAWVSWL